MIAHTATSTRFRQVARLGLVLAAYLSTIPAVAAQEPPPIDLSKLDMEDLMNVKVTSVSKREQSLARTAAAVFVINREDIRRSGATGIPDLLRMAPGVDVERIDNNAWAISVRGFNSRYSNKVLVLIDGRTVYTPSFSGVFWDHLDMPLENIERIEVIRGPGATVWGANAVNGVISIFTRSSKDIKGGLVAAGGGSQVHALGLVQYGGGAGKGGAYRAFGQYFDIGNSAMPDGSRAADHWMRVHGGFRADWDLSSRDSLMVQGDLFASEASQTRRTSFVATPFDRIFNQNLDAAGGDLLARWDHTLAGRSQTSFQSYYDSYRRTDYGVPEVMRTFDLDFQHHLAAGDRHDIVWGLGYRMSTSAVSPGYEVALSPPSQTASLFSAFLQDEIRASDSLWFTIGCKLVHNAFTGLETEPSARLAWSQKVAARLLEKLGHSVEVTSNGAEALAALTRGAFDLVLMDVQMPVMDGYDATQAIRAAEQGTPTHVPIVALTAHAMKGDREICLQAGMDDYLGKPIRPRELASVLERWGKPWPDATASLVALAEGSAAEPTAGQAKVGQAAAWPCPPAGA